ncbi:MAG: DUF1778 domain-containing protein [Cyanobacteria bacterium J06635_13]
MSTPSPKDSRIDLRLTQKQKTTIEQAAAMNGVSVSAYTLLHLLPQAQQDIEERERLTLSNRDRDTFLSALTSPPKLTGKLKAAIGQYREKYE